jgi:hypothetical protein
VYVTHNAVDQAMAAIAQADAPPDATQATSGIKLESHLATILDAYVRDAQPGEDRAAARQRIEAAIEQGSKATLSLKGLGLLEVPPVIPNVYRLDLSGNRLSTLPPLPCGIQNLDLARNRLRELTNQLPTQLIWLDVSHNNLTHLPETLPVRLTHLDVQDNGLRALPKKLPRRLHELNVNQNRGDLRAAAREHIDAVTRRRAFDVAMIGPGVSTARALSKLDDYRCRVSLDVAMACIPANRE